MQTWEYLTIQVPAKAGDCRIQHHPLTDKLTRLGAAGWELVSTMLLEDPIYGLMIFKRPAVNGEPGTNRSMERRLESMTLPRNGTSQPLTPPLQHREQETEELAALST